MNPDISLLHSYPFEKLNALKAGVTPVDKPHIALSIGEPKHPAPAMVLRALNESVNKVSVYPKTRGSDTLREAIAAWASRRFHLPAGSLSAQQHVLPVNGTREALFAFTQTIVDRSQDALVISPNPFYQIYEGAALLSGAQPHFLACEASNNYIPDFDAVPQQVWRQCQMIFLCSPGNPTGAVIDIDTLQKLIKLADQYDFVIASDECYSEIYFDELAPPCGLLQACAQMGRQDYARCVAFHSLSKRSNLPGLRSGFVAGDSELIKQFLLYRTYHGCAMAEQVQEASIIAWSDESHVQENRRVYKSKFDAVLDIIGDCLQVQRPDASFYLWPQTPIADTDFARQLYAQQNVTVLPGQYLSRNVGNVNPGANHVRIALVATMDECIEAANRIRTFVNGL